MTYDYDVTVIGGGPGGYVAGILAARQGKKTCLIEKERLGGTCLNRGCIPTKVFVKAAEDLSALRNAEAVGIVGVQKNAVSIDMQRLQKRKQGVTQQLVGGVQGLLKAAGAKVIEGTATLKDAHTVVLADGKEITSEYFIIATGSETLYPKSIPCEGDEVLTSTELLNLDVVPGSIAILGGGVIGIEFAYALSQFGSKVSVLEMAGEILPMVDAEIAAKARKSLEKGGVQFYMGAKVLSVKNGQVTYEMEGEEQTLQADYVLMSLGRRPSTEGFGAREVGLAYSGAVIACDESLKSSIDNIYVVGDANGKAMLAHTAFKEAEIAVANICGGQRTMRYDCIPSCIYMEPEIASVGLTEAQARERCGDDVKIGRFPLYANGKSLIDGGTDGMMKVILDSKYGEILGVHLFGAHTTEMIAQFATAMQSELTAEEVLETVFPHPSVSEGLGEAFLSAWKGSAIHNVG